MLQEVQLLEVPLRWLIQRELNDQEAFLPSRSLGPVSLTLNDTRSVGQECLLKTREEDLSVGVFHLDQIRRT